MATLTAERIKGKKPQALIEEKGRLYTHARTNNAHARTQEREIRQNL